MSSLSNFGLKAAVVILAKQSVVSVKASQSNGVNVMQEGLIVTTIIIVVS